MDENVSYIEVQIKRTRQLFDTFDALRETFFDNIDQFRQMEDSFLKKRDLRKILDEYNLATKGEVETIQLELTGKIGNIETRIGDLVKNQEDFDKLRRELDDEKNAAVRSEQERLTREKDDAVRTEQERLGKEKDDAIKAEQERLTKEKDDAVRAEQEKLGKEKEDAIRAEQERLGKEKDDAIKAEQERLTKEKDDAVRAEQEKLGKEKEDAIRAEQERLGKEKDDAIKAEQERLTKEKDDAVRAEQEKLGKEKEDAIRAEQERLGKEKDDAIKAEQERLTKEKDDAVNAAKADMKPWEDFAAPYKPVQEAMENCETFRSLLDKRNLTNIRGYIRAIGETIDFAKAVHTAAKEFKLKYEKPESMTDAEKAVYNSLNSCYREILGIDFDIFVMPGDKSIDEEFTKLPFNKDKVEYMLKPADKNFKYTQEVYVPMLKNTTGSMHYKAQVSAGNM